MTEGLFDRLLPRRKRAEAPKPQTDEQKLMETAEALVRTLKGKRYCNLVGSPEDTTAVVNQVTENLQEDNLVLRVSASPKIREVSQVLESFRGLAPEVSEVTSKPFLSVVQNFTTFFRRIAAESEKPVVAILENLQITEEGERGDLIRAVRALHNSRASERSLNNLTFLLAGNKHPTALLPKDRATPYNIGETFVIGVGA